MALPGHPFLTALSDSSGCSQRRCVHGQMCCSRAPPGHPADIVLWQPQALFLSVVCDFLSLQVLQILIYLRKPCYGDCQRSDASWGHAICDLPCPTQVTAADRFGVGMVQTGAVLAALRSHNTIFTSYLGRTRGFLDSQA